MYRAVTWLALRENLPLTDEAALSRLAAAAVIEFRPEAGSGGQEVYCQGENVTAAIRRPAVSRAVSLVSAVDGVRAAMLKAQRSLAADRDVVMEGRDIGTVVLPQAQCKIFLTASPEERAARRLLQLRGGGGAGEADAADAADAADVLARAGGMTPAEIEILRDMTKRDYQDSHRANSPTRPAEDSVILDTTSLSFSLVLERLLALARDRQRTAKTRDRLCQR
jgi:cytidylate kinase